ncbi:MAG: crossover junction endodeoxyribonuclease RuvC [Gammaproteobacteria bacterium]
MTSDMMRILGIDPGSRVTGYGIVESDGAQTRYVASGCIRVGGGNFSGRLNEIFTRIGDLVAEFAPHAVVVEQVFVHRNADSALKLGQARAAAICGTFAGDAELYEYAAREIKQAVVGRGGADKEQVQHMVRALLSLPQTPPPDEADALAAAICHAHGRRVNRALPSPGNARRAGGRRGWRRFAG